MDMLKTERSEADRPGVAEHSTRPRSRRPEGGASPRRKGESPPLRRPRALASVPRLAVVIVVFAVALGGCASENSGRAPDGPGSAAPADAGTSRMPEEAVACVVDTITGDRFCGRDAVDHCIELQESEELDALAHESCLDIATAVGVSEGIRAR